MNKEMLKALIISGDPGSGKSTVAETIAAGSGRFKNARLDQLTRPFMLGGPLNNNPRTLIVDEFEVTKKNISLIKSLIVNESITIDRKGMDQIVRETPNFILCTGKKDVLKLSTEDRRFMVLEIK